MKRNLLVLLALMGIALGAFAFSGSSPESDTANCPLNGTPACPEYPKCCK